MPDVVGDDARSREIAAFLADAGWEGADRTKLAGDLSPRRYERLRRDGRSAVLMNADPMRDRSTPAFVRITRWARDAGFSAPAVLFERQERGLLLLEDFGDDKVSGALRRGADPLPFYETAVDLLARIARTPAPEGLSRPGASELKDWLAPLAESYPVADFQAFNTFAAGLEKALRPLLDTPPSVSLRDFHVDNLMWLEHRSGHRRIGILDYQDAFLTHPAYDLASLVADARVDVDPDLARFCIRAYADATGGDEGAIGHAVAVLAAQRNARILGVLARSGRHLDCLPRVHGHVMRALSRPGLRHLVAEFAAAVPAPTEALLRELAA